MTRLALGRMIACTGTLLAWSILPATVPAQEFPSGTWNGGGGISSPPTSPFPGAQPAPAPAPRAQPKPRVQKPRPRKTVRRPQKLSDSAKIVVKVNDAPITAREISQRQRIMGGSDISSKVKAKMKSLINSPRTKARLKSILDDVVQANQGKSRDEIIAIFESRKKAFARNLQKEAIQSARASVSPAVRQKAKDALIDEQLKLQAAKEAGVTVSDADVDKRMLGVAQRNKMNLKEFAAHLKKMGIDIATMKSRTKAEMGWIEVVRKKFGHAIAITSRDVDRIVAANPDAEDGTELKLQRISLQLLNKVDQSNLAQRQLEAEAARANFRGCEHSAALANTIPGARFTDIGNRMPTAIPEPTRSLLLTARDGEMLPPSVGPTGIELWIVCGRNAVSADKQRREAAEDAAKQNEFQLLARKYLRDLRQDAVIDDREASGS